MTNNKQYIIIGHGFLGRNLSPLLPACSLLVSSRSMQNQNDGVDGDFSRFLFDLNDESSWASLDIIDNKLPCSVFFLLPPSQINLDNLSSFIRVLKDWNLHKAILTSSTVVYGNRKRVVNAESEVSLDSERAERQYQIEQTWLRLGSSAYIVRLAGLYGKGRVIGEKLLLRGSVIDSDANAYLNLIHIEDAANLLFMLEQTDQAARIELGCDGQAVKREEYYQYLASLIGAQSPVFNNDISKRGGNRICENQGTRDRITWQPSYADYQSGLKQIFSN